MNTSVVLMVLAIVIVGLILLTIIFFIKQPAKHLDKSKYRERWMTITSGLGDTSASQQVAIIQADKLLDSALKERGVAGETLGERMKNAKQLFSDRDGIWKAHKLRNHIAHDDDIKLDTRKTKRALESFKTALIDIGAL